MTAELLAVVTRAMEEAKTKLRHPSGASWPTDEQVVTAQLAAGVAAGLEHLMDGDGR